jgi:two-component system, NarL family, sensor histidine kinase UhpB
MNLRIRLQRRTLIVAAATAAGLATALALWTINDTRREIEATRELVRAIVEAVLQAQAGTGATDAATAPAHSGSTTIRHVTIGLKDSTHQSAEPATHWVDRLIDSRVERIAVTPDGRFDMSAPALLVGANARSELYEHMLFAAAAFVGLAVFGLMVAAVQYRTLLRAFSPVQTFTQRLRDFEGGDLAARLPEPELDELSAIARSFNRLADSLQQTVEEQQRLSSALLSLRSDERQRLARELHDDLGQAVTALSVHLAVVRQSLNAGALAASGIDRVERDVEGLRAATRAMLADLRDDQAVDGLTRLDPKRIVAQWRRNRPNVDWRLDGPWDEMIERLRLPEYGAACRVLQESLTNAFRHADPSEIVVEFKPTPGADRDQAWSLVVENDGVAARARNGIGLGLGLRGMQERAHAVGATLSAAPIGPQRWRVSLQLAAGTAA